ncbi:MAG: hypothetical protein ABEK59_00760 [Halobacteria archaeon]
MINGSNRTINFAGKLNESFKNLWYKKAGELPVINIDNEKSWKEARKAPDGTTPQ